jgi:ribosomal protein S6--L-glutamate ligase
LEQIIFRMDLLNDAEWHGQRIINPPRAMETCIDKFLTDTRLRQAGLPHPQTVVCQVTEDAMSGFETLGRDVVVKPLFGSEGRGMVRVTEPELAWRTFHAIEQTGGVIYLQQYVHHSGWDLRLFVIGEEVVACMLRRNSQDWRTNVAQGATTEHYHPNEELQHLAVKAARAMGALIAGVDLMQTPEGNWLVTEVNAAPGWRSLAETCQVDIARLIIRFTTQE